MLADTVSRNGSQKKGKLIVALLVMAMCMAAYGLNPITFHDVRCFLFRELQKRFTPNQTLIYQRAAEECVLAENRICLTCDGEVQVLEPDGTMLYAGPEGEENLHLRGGGNLAVSYAYGARYLTILHANGPQRIPVDGEILYIGGMTEKIIPVVIRKSGSYGDVLLLDESGQSLGKIVFRDELPVQLVAVSQGNLLYGICVTNRDTWQLQCWNTEGKALWIRELPEEIMELSVAGSDAVVTAEHEVLRIDPNGQTVYEIPTEGTVKLSGNVHGELAMMESYGGAYCLSILGENGNVSFRKGIQRQPQGILLTETYLGVLDCEMLSIYAMDGTLLRRIENNGSFQTISANENYVCISGLSGINTMKLNVTVPGLYG